MSGQNHELSAAILAFEALLNTKIAAARSERLVLVSLFSFGLRFSFCLSFRLSYGLGLCSANFRRNGWASDGNRHFAQQQKLFAMR
jgi:hypothetical protein